jgi:hypothetical protein
MMTSRQHLGRTVKATLPRRALFSPAQPCATFSPTDPPIAMQSHTRDVRFTQSHPPSPAHAKTCALPNLTRPALRTPRRALYPCKHRY